MTFAALIRDHITTTQWWFDNTDNITEKALVDFCFNFLTSKVLLFLLLLGLGLFLSFFSFLFPSQLFSFLFFVFLLFLSVFFFFSIMGFTVVSFEFLYSTFRLSCIRLFLLYGTVFSFFSTLLVVHVNNNGKMGGCGIKIGTKRTVMA